MAIRAVIFDIGDVLEVNPRTGWQDRWAEALGLPRAEFDRRLDRPFAAGSVGDLALPEVESEVANALGLAETDIERLMDDAWTEYLGTLNAELVAYFASLRPRYATGILSNSFVGAREREQARYGFEDICDVVVYSHEEGLMKPAPAIFRIACERLAVALEDTVFLDDVAGHVEAAADLGMHAIHFADNAQAIGELERTLRSR